MIERDPSSYGRFRNNDYVQPGGPTNPLGARALYLFQNGRDTFYRIHGTTEPQSIGRSPGSTARPSFISASATRQPSAISRANTLF